MYYSHHAALNSRRFVHPSSASFHSVYRRSQSEHPPNPPRTAVPRHVNIVHVHFRLLNARCNHILSHRPSASCESLRHSRCTCMGRSFISRSVTESKPPYIRCGHSLVLVTSLLRLLSTATYHYPRSRYYMAHSKPIRFIVSALQRSLPSRSPTPCNTC